MSAYQRRRLIVDAPLLNDVATGQSIANYLILTRKDPAGRVTTIAPGSAAMAQIMARFDDTVEPPLNSASYSIIEPFLFLETHSRIQRSVRPASRPRPSNWSHCTDRIIIPKKKPLPNNRQGL